jgi:hypothetical protein
VKEQEAYAKYGPNYLDHLAPKARENAFQAASRREHIAKLYSKDIGPDWYEIIMEATKQRLQSRENEERIRSLQELQIQDAALKEASKQIWDDSGLTHAERAEKTQSLRRQRYAIYKQSSRITADKKISDRILIGKILAERGRTPPDWCRSPQDVPETNNEQ